MPKTIEICQVNAFSRSMHSGSPTAVVLNADDLGNSEMLEVAQQSGTSHTAFISNEKEVDFSIRFFTKNGEVKNCAHATIAASYLYAHAAGNHGKAVFHQRTISGVQRIEIIRQSDGLYVYFTQNEIKFRIPEKRFIEELFLHLQISPADLDEKYPVVFASPGSFRMLVGINSNRILQQIHPDFSMLREWSKQHDLMGFYFYTMLETKDFMAKARMFAPIIGVDEDVINGNSTGCLSAWLLKLTSAVEQRSELHLTVDQGHAFNRVGRVMGISNKNGEHIQTVVGGTAVITGKINYAIGKSNPR